MTLVQNKVIFSRDVKFNESERKEKTEINCDDPVHYKELDLTDDTELVSITLKIVPLSNLMLSQYLEDLHERENLQILWNKSKCCESESQRTQIYQGSN